MAERKITIRRVMAGEREISYQLERKAVKNLNLRVREDGSVYASAPRQVSAAEIDAFVASRGAFILQAVARMEERQRRRALLEQGEAEAARRFLGRPFAIAGPVRRGKGLGSSRLDAPTVNLVPDGHQLIPAFGVYVTRVTVEGHSGPAVTNVGVRPTVDTDGGVTVESHLLDQQGDLYGARCRVEFLQMLRPERRFESLADLRRQIARDGEAARAYFQSIS